MEEKPTGPTNGLEAYPEHGPVAVSLKVVVGMVGGKDRLHASVWDMILDHFFHEKDLEYQPPLTNENNT